VGRFSVIADPQGATFSLIQMTVMHFPATACGGGWRGTREENNWPPMNTDKRG
jgi:hypothetical protein